MIVTAFYTGLLALLLIGLSLRAALYRKGKRIGLGLADDRELEKRVRAHGNYTEYVPFALLQLALLELLQAAPLLLHLAGATLLLGRLLHAWGLSRSSGASPGRLAGMVLTWLAILLMALMLLAEAVPKLA